MGLRRLLFVVAALAILVAPDLAHAQETPEAPAAELVPGTGAASAAIVKTRLFYAGYSLQVSLGLAATSYENRQSRSLGSAYDLSSALGLVKVKVPELAPISIDSNAGDAEAHQDLGAGPILGAIDLRATRSPASTSEVRLADLDLPGLVRVEGGHATSSSSIVDGTSRRATASVTIGAVSLLGGVVTLDGLRWDVIHQTGAEERAEATFSVAGLSIAGVPIALDLQALAPVLDAVNAVLGPVGLVVELPELVRRPNGSVEISPLRVGLLNSPLGAEIVGPLVAAVRPLLVPVYQALTDINATLGLTSLVADLGLGVADGSGGIELAIGGATAITDDTEFADPLAPPPTTPTIDPGPADDGGGAPTVGQSPAPPALGVAAPAVPGTTGTGPALVPVSSEGPARCVLAASPRRQGTCRGTNVAGAVAVVAVIAVGLYAHDVRLRRRREVAA